MSTRTRAGRVNSVETKQPRRQADACVRCYEKKVRCDTERGQPCTGCARDGITCQKRMRKPYPPRKEASGAAAPKTDGSRSSPRHVSIPRTQMPTPPRSVHSESPPTSLFTPEQFDFSSSYLETGSTNAFNAAHEIPAAMAHVNGQNTAMANHVALLNGDGPGYASFLDICNAERVQIAQQLPGHESSTNALGPHELTYAEAKGCFSMPSHAICDDLVHCYFHYVHPMLPIIEIAEFLEQYTHGSFDDTSLLLLWSMFSLAANYVSDSTLALSGHTSRHELNKSMYERAKCLHDLGYEHDYITVIQSTLLLGHCCSSLLDHAQSWHWTGIAISTAQTVGLHRDPNSGYLGSTISTPHRRLWANLWWCCFYGDRLLSLGYGKPLRINADDCDVPMVGPGCMLELPDHAPKAWHKYVPVELPHLMPIWAGLLKLAIVIGNILTVNYQARKVLLDNLRIASLERQVVECLPEQQTHTVASELLSYSQSHAGLHVEAALIALYRPYASDFSTPCASNINLANGRVMTAATRAGSILERILSSNTLRFAGPMMMPLLVPSMAVHSIQAKSHDPFTSSWSRSCLELYLRVQQRLENRQPNTALATPLFIQPNEMKLRPFDLSGQSTSSSSDSSYDQGAHHWHGTLLNLHHNSSASLTGQPALWQSPEMNQEFDLWSFTPPEDKLFFPLDDISTM